VGAAGLPAWAEATPERRAHIARVAALVGEWAARLGVADAERDRWLRAAWLHDALRDAAPEELERLAPDSPGPAELRHGPASAARAEAEGECDSAVLDAVRYHTVGFEGWAMTGWVLYCADYLEPGREFDRPRRAALARRFPDDPGGVLREVAAARLTHAIASGWPIAEPTCAFWNGLVSPGPPPA
jgi:HD superfamily phosphohydrolase YqeK